MKTISIRAALVVVIFAASILPRPLAAQDPAIDSLAREFETLAAEPASEAIVEPSAESEPVVETTVPELEIAVVEGPIPVEPEQVAAEEPEPREIIGNYRRSSLYTMFIAHPDQKFGGEIQSAFLAMPTPDKFDDHSIGDHYKTIVSTTNSKRKSKKSDANFPDIDRHIASNNIPRMLVAKWFNRHPDTGAFDMTIVGERGNYDATLADVALADMSARGRASLADAGEELIGKTFVLVNDITYIDKGERTAAAGGVLKFLGALTGALFDSGIGNTISAVGAITEQFDGFSVRITSYLYRLDWNPEVAATFYQDYWTDRHSYDPARVAAFDNSDLFRLTYIGNHTATKGNVEIKGFKQETDEVTIGRVCTRALDAAIVELQRTYNEFKVATPIYAVEGSDVLVQIGLKEGISERSRFEVLQAREMPDGRTEYRRVGVIAPIKGQIWDNRYMAAEEAAELAAADVDNPDPDAKGGDVHLSATRFRKEGVFNVYPGLLVREITFK